MTLDDVPLPPLPESEWCKWCGQNITFNTLDESSMRAYASAYGLACFNAAIEAAAKECGTFTYAESAVDFIRALRIQPKGT